MPKTWLFLVAALLGLLVLSMVAGNRIAAGAGALMLIGTIIYVTVSQRRDSKNFAQAEQGAKDLREDLNARDNP
jgi:hypothetical protein